MGYKLSIMIACLMLVLSLAGCKEGASSLLGGGATAIDVALSGGDSGSGSGSAVVHLPEPTTMALLGSGLLAYALFKRKKKQ